MGDTGSLTIGGIIAVIYHCRKSHVPLICGIFLIEVISVIVQSVIFKYEKIGVGKKSFSNVTSSSSFQKKEFMRAK